MKLPEYDNHPPGTPLYQDNRSNPWDDIKFPLQAIVSGILGIIGIGCTVTLLVAVLRGILH